jgi:transposase InsO family protein
MSPTGLPASAAVPGYATSTPGPNTPRTNGKAERFIQTLLREWAYRRPYPSSRQRTEALPAWLYYYNWARGHGALHGRPPITCLVAPNNLVAVQS